MTASQPQRVEVTPKSLTGLKDTRGESIRRQLSSDYGLEISEVRLDDTMESLKELCRDELSTLSERPVLELFEVRFSSSI